jgi:translation initiation factor IF-1
MAKQTSIEQDGTIIEALSNAMFKVELGKWASIDCAYFR